MPRPPQFGQKTRPLHENPPGARSGTAYSAGARSRRPASRTEESYGTPAPEPRQPLVVAQARGACAEGLEVVAHDDTAHLPRGSRGRYASDGRPMPPVIHRRGRTTNPTIHMEIAGPRLSPARIASVRLRGGGKFRRRIRASFSSAVMPGARPTHAPNVVGCRSTRSRAHLAQSPGPGQPMPY
jgi:hypothetical protein